MTVSKIQSQSIGSNPLTLYIHLKHLRNTLVITLVNISLNTLPLVIIPHNHHLQLFAPGPDVGFGGLIVSFKHFNSYYVYSFIIQFTGGGVM